MQSVLSFSYEVSGPRPGRLQFAFQVEEGATTGLGSTLIVGAEGGPVIVPAEE